MPQKTACGAFRQLPRAVAKVPSPNSTTAVAVGDNFPKSNAPRGVNNLGLVFRRETSKSVDNGRGVTNQHPPGTGRIRAEAAIARRVSSPQRKEAPIPGPGLPMRPPCFALRCAVRKGVQWICTGSSRTP
jgi:hypothetical protein